MFFTMKTCLLLHNMILDDERDICDQSHVYNYDHHPHAKASNVFHEYYDAQNSSIQYGYNSLHGELK